MNRAAEVISVDFPEVSDKQKRKRERDGGNVWQGEYKCRFAQRLRAVLRDLS